MQHKPLSDMDEDAVYAAIDAALVEHDRLAAEFMRDHERRFRSAPWMERRIAGLLERAPAWTRTLATRITGRYVSTLTIAGERLSIFRRPGYVQFRPLYLGDDDDA